MNDRKEHFIAKKCSEEDKVVENDPTVLPCEHDDKVKMGQINKLTNRKGIDLSKFGRFGCCDYEIDDILKDMFSS